MKKFLLLLFIVCSLNVIGQIYDAPMRSKIPPTMRIYSLGIYKMGADNYYHYESYSIPELLTSSDYLSTSKGNEHFFCYSKQAKRYYFYTDNLIGFYFPTDNIMENDLRSAMDDNHVKKIDLKELPSYVNEVVNKMNERYREINDSIKEKIVAEKKIQREKYVQDSISAAQKKSAEKEEYRKTHNWRELEMSNAYKFECKFCDKSHSLKKMMVLSLSADTVYYLQDEPDLSLIGINHFTIHYSPLTNVIKNDPKFIDHIDTWRDSIANHNNMRNQDADILNIVHYNEFNQKVCNRAPYGFIERWGWHLNSADGIEPYFTFHNTAKKTIKYVDFYFSVFNAVGDKCYLKYNKSYIGNVRGVGPVEQYESGSWNWDRATHYTSSDASEMRIIKLVITYMDGTTKIIPKDSIIYDD